MLSALLCGCDEAPTGISRDRLTFLGEQQRPLMLSQVIERCGPTPPGPEPYFGYMLPDSTTINFWMYDTPAMAADDEISMVVETAPGGKPRIIWPADLVGTSAYAVLKKT